MFVVAATRLVNDLEAVRDQPTNKETAAIIAAEEISARLATGQRALNATVMVIRKSVGTSFNRSGS